MNCLIFLSQFSKKELLEFLEIHQNKKLIPINEETEIAKIKGFVFKPEYSRKTRSAQFFFVNKRFI